jgi:hypothetical protein
MPDVSRPLGRTILDGLAGLVYDDPITLWGSALAIVVTWGLTEVGVVEGIWVGAILFVGVWAAIAASLLRAARTRNR